MRIIEQWLKILFYKNEISNVAINVETKNNLLVLTIEDNSSIIDFAGRETEMLRNFISDKVQSRGGIIDLSMSSYGTNILKINRTLIKPDAGSGKAKKAIQFQACNLLK